MTAAIAERSHTEGSMSSWLWIFLILATSVTSNQLDSSSSCDSSQSSNITTSHEESVAIVLQALQICLKADQIETNRDELLARGKPWNSYHSSDRSPDIIVYPESTQDVSNILRICNQYQFPVIAFGGGTSIEGHTLALKGGLSLDLNRMKRIIALHEQVSISLGVYFPCHPQSLGSGYDRGSRIGVH
jgi:hypothetical protein